MINSPILVMKKNLTKLSFKSTAAIFQTCKVKLGAVIEMLFLHDMKQAKTHVQKYHTKYENITSILNKKSLFCSVN